MDLVQVVRDGVELDLDELRQMASPEAPAPTSSARAALQQIRTGLDALAALSPADLPPTQGLETAAALLVAQDRVQALALRSVADVHTRDLWALDGSPSTGTWIDEQHTSMPRSHVALAGKLDRVPQVAARIAAGGLSVEGGMRIGRALDQLRPQVDRTDGLIDGQPAQEALTGVAVDGVCQLVGEVYGGLGDADPRLVAVRERLAGIVESSTPEIVRLESTFLLLAEHVPNRLLHRALAVLVDALLPQQLAERSEDARARRGLALVRDPAGSGWLLRGHLDDECGERLQCALSAVMSTDPENTEDTAARQSVTQKTDGDGPGDEPRLPRSKGARRHDALSLLLAKVLDNRLLGSRSKTPVQIGVTVSLDALHDQPGALPARTSSGAIVPAALVRTWLCDSALTRYVLSLGNKVIETSHTVRTLKPHERRIKQLETGGVCQVAGCSRGSPTGDTLIPHHAAPYKTSGRTSLSDSVMVCDVSHDDLHVGGKTLRLKDGRLINEHGWVAGPDR